MFISSGSIFHLKDKEHSSLGLRGNAKVTQAVSDGTGIPTRSDWCHLRAVCSPAPSPDEEFGDTEGSASFI